MKEGDFFKKCTFYPFLTRIFLEGPWFSALGEGIGFWTLFKKIKVSIYFPKQFRSILQTSVVQCWKYVDLPRYFKKTCLSFNFMSSPEPFTGRICSFLLLRIWENKTRRFKLLTQQGQVRSQKLLFPSFEWNCNNNLPAFECEQCSVSIQGQVATTVFPEFFPMSSLTTCADLLPGREPCCPFHNRCYFLRSGSARNVARQRRSLIHSLFYISGENTERRKRVFFSFQIRCEITVLTHLLLLPSRWHPKKTITK